MQGMPTALCSLEGSRDEILTRNIFIALQNTSVPLTTKAANSLTLLIKEVLAAFMLEFLCKRDLEADYVVGNGET